MEEEKKKDYLEKVFEAIKEANAEMGKFGVRLRWDFKIEAAPVYETRSFGGDDPE